MKDSSLCDRCLEMCISDFTLINRLSNFHEIVYILCPVFVLIKCLWL